MKFAQFILGAFFVLTHLLSVGQIANDKDSISATDSLKIYRGIHRIASKHKVTFWIYRLVFNEPRNIVLPRKSENNFVSRDDIIQNKGKIVRQIQIKVLDPFGYVIQDSLYQDSSIIKIAGNKLHIQSKSRSIKNLLLFKENQPFDPLLIKESERIVRQSSYIRDAKISARIADHSNDSVDVYVVVQDLWTATGFASVSSTTNKISLREKNFLGISHQFEHTIQYDIPSTKLQYLGSYLIPGIKNTFISANAFVKVASENGFLGINLNRPFYSPLTKWAGGINLLRIQVPRAQAAQAMTYTTIQQDYWIGRSFKLTGGYTEIDRTTKFLMASRVLNKIHFSERKVVSDSAIGIEPYLLYLNSFGLSMRRYYKERNLFRFGATEDVPEGLLATITIGLNRNSSHIAYYMGMRGLLGEHIEKTGYFSIGLDYGFFLNNGIKNNGVFNFHGKYFSDIIRFSQKWGMRQFVDFRMTYGINRADEELISINNDLFGYNRVQFTGNKKVFIDTRSVLYTPVKIIGFEIGAIFFAGIGGINTMGRKEIADGKLFQVYGLGLLIRNEHLVNSTFELSFALYPNIGPGGSIDYKINPIGIYDARQGDFAPSRPELFPYQ